MSALLTDGSQTNQVTTTGQPAPPLVTATLPRKTLRDEVFSLPEGEIRLVWPAPLSVDSYGEVKQWIELIKLKMQRSLPEGGRT
jgi:hypothetical protein